MIYDEKEIELRKKKYFQFKKENSFKKNFQLFILLCK